MNTHFCDLLIHALLSISFSSAVAMLLYALCAVLSIMSGLIPGDLLSDVAHTPCTGPAVMLASASGP